ncbi:glycosyltransferase family 2 protein [Pseudomonas putida]|nr:glycosyltransferase family 2 protein [Pseudomonas putida]
MTKIDIVIPVYNALSYVKLLLESLNNQTCLAKNINVIIVDDASEPETNAFLLRYKRSKENVTLITNKENMGYTRSLNKGIRAGTAPLVIQVNSDCVLSSKAVEKLARWFSRDEALFALSPMSNAASWQSIPKLFDEHGGMAVNETLAGLSVDQMDDFCESYGSGLAETQLLNGFCIMYRRDMLEIIGLADEESFPKGYGEEDDLHLRAANADLKIAVATNCYVYHNKTKSFSTEQRSALTVEGRKIINERYSNERVVRITGSLKEHPRFYSIKTASNFYSDVHISPMRAYLAIDWDQCVKNRAENTVSFIMPVYKDGEMTRDAIVSLYNSLPSSMSCEIVAVLNGASEDCVSVIESLREKCNLKIVSLPENLFFSMGCNMGFKESKGDTVIFVNNDMIFNSEPWIESITDALKVSSVGCASIKLVYEDQTIQSAGFVWADQSFFPVEINKNLPSHSATGKFECFGATGACLGMRATDFAYLKGFDPLFINGSEDIDLCMKINVILNKKTHVNLSYSAVHLESKSPGRATWIKSNRKLFYLRWAGYISGIGYSFDKTVVAADNLPSPIRMYKAVM